MPTPKYKKTRTAQAVAATREAWYDANRGYQHLVPMFERQAAELMIPSSPPEISCGEVLPVPTEDTNWHSTVRDTLVNPDSPSVDASVSRTDMLERAHSLDTGIDAANSIQARNSLEKMLAHQMATCHVKAMGLIGDSNNSPWNPEAQLLQLKKLALAAKFMDVYQKGFDTLIRTRNAGKQTSVVKQVHVTGGQNVIADNVTTGGAYGGE